MTRVMGMENIFMHDINHSMYASYIVWNVDVVTCHCMCILGGE